MARWNIAEKNGLWKGGRSIASNGYVLVRVGCDHHLADVRGYAYEHRLVAEQKIGRRLLPGEQVHHIDGNKQNNAPDNLEVAQDTAHHAVRHRRAGSTLRVPGEPNPVVFCACGCGTSFLMYDGGNRPRRYVSGHNPARSPTADGVRRLLAGGPVSRSQVADELGITKHSASLCLSRLCRRGEVERCGRLWRLTRVSQ